MVDLRASWTKDEELYLKAVISGACATSAQRIARFAGEYAARPYYDRVESLAGDIDNSYDWRRLTEFRLIDLKILQELRFDKSDIERNRYLRGRAIDALRICADWKTKKFARLHRSARVSFAVSLNNIAVARGSLEAAMEALSCISELDRKERVGLAFVEYVTAFSMWQVARLTTLDNLDQRGEKARQAHLKAQEALRTAMQRNDQTLISLTHEVLRAVERDFPEFSVDLNVAASVSRLRR